MGEKVLLVCMHVCVYMNVCSYVCVYIGVQVYRCTGV